MDVARARLICNENRGKGRGGETYTKDEREREKGEHSIDQAFNRRRHRLLQLARRNVTGKIAADPKGTERERADTRGGRNSFGETVKSSVVLVDSSVRAFNEGIDRILWPAV